MTAFKCLVAAIDKLVLIAQQSVEHAPQHLCCGRALAALHYGGGHQRHPTATVCNVKAHCIQWHTLVSIGFRY